MQPMPAGKVEIAAIHDVERAGFPDELVEDVDIMRTASGDNDGSGKLPRCFRWNGNWAGRFPALEGQ